MNYFNKKINIILFIFLFFFFSLGSISIANASVTYRKQIAGFGGSKIVFDDSTKPLGDYIKDIYEYGVGITAIIATVVLMVGGFQWIIAGGSGEKIGEAKAWITAALSGLVLALSSYMILNLVNPALVNFTVKKIIVIKPIEKENPYGECKKQDLGGSTSCKDVLGDGWIKVDSPYCSSLTGAGMYCCCKEKIVTSATPTEFHKECRKVESMVTGEPATYHCQLIAGSGPSTCSADSGCNATNSK